MSIPTSTESLTRLAQVIDADLGDVDSLPTGESASLVRVTRTGEIAVRSLDGDHPYDALLGFVAPDDWEILGVIAPGWGTYYAGPSKGERRRVRVVFVASRRGEEASLLRFAGDEEPTIMTEAQAPGRVADCVRRALDVATPAEPDDSLLALWWDRVLQVLCARNHPSFGGTLVDVAEMETIIGARPLSCADERWAVAQGGGNVYMDGAVAAWMDDGMFARYMLAELADADVALPAAKRACTGEAWTYLLQRFADSVLADEPLESRDGRP